MIEVQARAVVMVPPKAGAKPRAIELASVAECDELIIAVSAAKSMLLAAAGDASGQDGPAVPVQAARDDTWVRDIPDALEIAGLDREMRGAGDDPVAGDKAARGSGAPQAACACGHDEGHHGLEATGIPGAYRLAGCGGCGCGEFREAPALAEAAGPGREARGPGDDSIAGDRVAASAPVLACGCALPGLELEPGTPAHCVSHGRTTVAGDGGPAGAGDPVSVRAGDYVTYAGPVPPEADPRGRVMRVYVVGHTGQRRATVEFAPVSREAGPLAVILDVAADELTAVRDPRERDGLADAADPRCDAAAEPGDDDGCLTPSPDDSGACVRAAGHDAVAGTPHRDERGHEFTDFGWLIAPQSRTAQAGERAASVIGERPAPPSVSDEVREEMAAVLADPAASRDAVLAALRARHGWPRGGGAARVAAQQAIDERLADGVMAGRPVPLTTEGMAAGRPALAGGPR